MNTAQAFPIGDWQFWVVTVLALVAVLWLLRNVLPIRRLLGRRKPSAKRRATLTIGGKSVGKR